MPDPNPQYPKPKKVSSTKVYLFIETFSRLRATGKSDFDERAGILDAMKAAGYARRGGDAALLRHGRHLLRAYDKLEEDPLDIFKSVAFGPREIAQRLKEESENQQSATARVQALNIASKCVGMQREALDLELGVPIVIKKPGKPEEKSSAPQKRGRAFQVSRAEH